MIHHKKQRLYFLIFLFLSCAVAAFFIVRSLNKNLVFFFTPSEIIQQNISLGQPVRIGGIVEKGSIQVDPLSLDLHFNIHDQKNKISISYQGIVPGLFREGQGIIAEGTLIEKSHFKALKILVKHDETYKAPSSLQNQKMNKEDKQSLLKSLSQ
jgi:cytochrome c-type biogenesis protein CcmE